MKTIIISLLVLSLFLFSCINTFSDTSSDEIESKVNETETHHHESESESLVLNNGEKWKVDNNMMVFIQSMEESIKSFSPTNQNAYQLLADDLQKNVKLLTTNCTMSGMAHDELHKWLVPYITAVNGLSEAENETEANEIFLAIQDSFKTFNQYFQ
jgi:hypothetical protein